MGYIYQLLHRKTPQQIRKKPGFKVACEINKGIMTPINTKKTHLCRFISGCSPLCYGIKIQIKFHRKVLDEHIIGCINEVSLASFPPEMLTSRMLFMFVTMFSSPFQCHHHAVHYPAQHIIFGRNNHLVITIQHPHPIGMLIMESNKTFTFAIRSIIPKVDTVPPHKDRKSTRLNSSHVKISYAVFCLKKKKLC